MEHLDEILFEQRGVAGFVTLNKPQTLNAVTGSMISALNEQLTVWESDPTIERVVIRAAPGKAFSAGGDIRNLYDRGTRGDFDFEFFAEEYVLNARIARFPKPYVALVNGIAMGGGVGVSFHGSHVVAGENLMFAMPEVGIGFFPDVGASHFLPKLPGKLGLYLGLTGARLKQGDAIWSRLVTNTCSNDRWSEMERALEEAGETGQILDAYNMPHPGVPIETQLTEINELFAASTLSGVIEKLTEASQHSDFARDTLQTIMQKSPTSLEIAFRQITSGEGMSIEDCMCMEYRILRNILPGHDFYEGIRAAIIDKDKAPVWQPADLASVDPKQINAHFAPIGPLELKP